jgi:hypothetical protein
MVFTHRQYGRCVRPWSGDTSVLYQAAATRGQTRGLLSAAGGRRRGARRLFCGSRAYYRHKKRKPFASHQFCVRHQG